MILVQDVKIEKQKGLGKIINILLNIFIVIFGILLLISIYNNIQINILKNDYSSFFDYSIFEVQTGSMSGEIESGDWVVVKVTKDIELDDIITFKQGDEFTTHRVIEKYNDTYVTKGDVNNSKDEPITDDDIVGKVVKVLPHFGILRKTLFNPWVVISLIVTLFLINSALKKEDSKKEEQIKQKVTDIIEKIPKKNSKEKEETQDKKQERIIMRFRKKIDHSKDNLKKVKSNNSKIKVNKINGNDDDIELLEVEELFPSEEDDLDKTMYFRMIQVDKDEIEKTYSKINESKQENEIIIDNKEDDKEEVKEEVIKHNLELLQNKRKKCKNIIEKAMVIKEDELEELIKTINFGSELKVNEPTIKDTFLKSYIDAKYYNHCGDINVSYDGRNVVPRIDELLDEVKDKLIEDYKGSDINYKNKVIKFNIIFKIINYIEKNAKVKELEEKKKRYKNKLLEYLNTDYLTDKDIDKLVSKLIKITKTYRSMLKYSLDKMQTNLFELKCGRISDSKIYATKIEHNLSFSKVYSDYIIEKTYNEGIVAEDKLAVLLNILSTKIVNNMLEGNFSTKYLIYIPYDLYEKSTKIGNIFEMFEDEFAKNTIIVLLNYSELNSKRDVIKSLIKKGYKFAINIGSNIIKESDLELMYIVEYIFMENEEDKKQIPKDLRNKVICDDVMDKIN